MDGNIKGENFSKERKILELIDKRVEIFIEVILSMIILNIILTILVLFEQMSSISLIRFCIPN